MNLSHHIILRIESFFIFLSGIFFYHQFNMSWQFFFIIFFIPDISILAYFINKKIGALFYNLTHNYIFPIILLILFYDNTLLLSLAFIWITHIGFDRMLGFGLKSTQGFYYTHLMLAPKAPETL